MTAGQRLARLVTDAVVRSPAVWPVFRRPFRLMFDRLAPTWDVGRGSDHVAPLEAALERVAPPGRALDLGTGTGLGAIAIARRFPDAEVVGVDLAPAMIEEARGKLTPELAGRVRFAIADGERLPFEDGAFDLVALVNMIPFFDELTRVTAASGYVVFSFSWGDETPIFVPPPRLRRALGARGFSHFAEFSAGKGTAFLARRGPGR